MYVLSYRLTVRNPKDIVTEKGDKKCLLLFLSVIFYHSFRGENKIKCEILEKSRPGMAMVNEERERVGLQFAG